MLSFKLSQTKDQTFPVVSYFLGRIPSWLLGLSLCGAQTECLFHLFPRKQCTGYCMFANYCIKLLTSLQSKCSLRVKLLPSFSAAKQREGASPFGFAFPVKQKGQKELLASLPAHREMQAPAAAPQRPDHCALGSSPLRFAGTWCEQAPFTWAGGRHHTACTDGTASKQDRKIFPGLLHALLEIKL